MKIERVRDVCLFLLLVAGAGSCASTETAIEVTRLVEASSKEARLVLDNVAAVSNQQLQAYRSLCEGTSTSTANLQKQLAREKMAAIVSKTQRELEAACADFSLKSVRALEASATESLNALLGRALEESYAHAAKLKSEAQTAEEKAKEFPDELPLRAAADKASLLYFAFAARLNETESDALERARSAIRARTSEGVQRVLSHLNSQSSKLEEHLRESMDSVEATDAKQLPVIEDPFAISVKGLRDYVDQVDRAQQALRDYVETTDLSVGNALLKRFVSSMRTSFVGGLTGKDASKLPSVSDAMEQWKLLGSDALAKLKDQVAAAKTETANWLREQESTIRGEIGKTVQDVLANLTGPSTTTSTTTEK